MKIGVLALQGGVEEHTKMLRTCGVNPVEVRVPEDLESADGLIIPGGESTTITTLMKKSGLDKEITKRAKNSFPIFGTCAGLIVLAKEIAGKQSSLGLMNIKAKRNDYGRQVDSFETIINIPIINPRPFRAVFIRAPTFEAGEDVEVLASFNKQAVLAKQNNLLVSSFHPELTNDKRIHKYFIELVKKSRYIKDKEQ